jgi:hypothetical protein
MSSISPCQISSNPLLTPYILMTPVLQLLCPLLTSPILLTRISPQPLLTFLLIPITPYSLFFPSFLLTPTSHTLLLTTTFPHSVSPQTHFFAPPAGRVPPPPTTICGAQSPRLFRRARLGHSREEGVILKAAAQHPEHRDPAAGGGRGWKWAQLSAPPPACFPLASRVCRRQSPRPRLGRGLTQAVFLLVMTL